MVPEQKHALLETTEAAMSDFSVFLHTSLGRISDLDAHVEM